VRAIFVEVPQEILDHRRVTGIDRYDEMWEGVLHMAPAPRINHQAVVAALIGALAHAVRGSDRLVVDGINVCDPADFANNYRVPDVCVLRRDIPAVGDDFGRAEGVLLAVEVRSPRDETYDKFSFYAERGIGELLVIDVPLGRVEAYALIGGTYVMSVPVDGWAMTSYAVGVRIEEAGVVVRWADHTEQTV
jgi:Uma2 family endonuclease